MRKWRKKLQNKNVFVSVLERTTKRLRSCFLTAVMAHKKTGFAELKVLSLLQPSMSH